MGFGSFLKKALNPLTPFKAGHNSAKQLLKGNIKGALRTSLDAVPGSPTLGMGGRGGGGAMSQAPPPMMEGAQDYMNTFDPAEQQRIQGTFADNPNGMNDWFSGAKAAGVPMPGAAPAPAAMAAPAAAPAPAAPEGIAKAVMEARRRNEIMQGMGGGRAGGVM